MLVVVVGVIGHGGRTKDSKRKKKAGIQILKTESWEPRPKKKNLGSSDKDEGRESLY